MGNMKEEARLPARLARLPAHSRTCAACVAPQLPAPPQLRQV